MKNKTGATHFIAIATVLLSVLLIGMPEFVSKTLGQYSNYLYGLGLGLIVLSILFSLGSFIKYSLVLSLWIGVGFFIYNKSDFPKEKMFSAEVGQMDSDIFTKKISGFTEIVKGYLK